MEPDFLTNYIVPDISGQEIAILMKEYIPYSIEEKLNHYNILQHEVLEHHSNNLEIEKELLTSQALLKEIQREYNFSEFEFGEAIKAQVKNHIDSFINDNSKSSFEKLEWVNQQLQKHFMRHDGIERNMVKDVPLAIKEKLIPILQKAFANEINLDAPARKILLYGGSEESMVFRINLLKDILLKINSKDEGLVEIFVLTGARDLWPINEKSTEIFLIEQFISQLNYTTSSAKEVISGEFARFFANIKDANDVREKRIEIIKHFQKFYSIKWPTETDMIKKFIDEDKFFNKWKMHYIDAPKKPDGSRPETYDTLILWWQEYSVDLINNKNLEVYGISSQPVALYQLEKSRSFAFNNHLPDNIKFNIIADGTDLKKGKHFSTALDSLARIIYSRKSLKT